MPRLEDTMRVNAGAKFTIKPTAEQRAGFARHAGARRYAFNWCVANNKKVYERWKHDKSVKVPRSGFDNIKAFGAWKLSAEAGCDEKGKLGLAWRHEVHQQVFEEAAQDFARGLAAAISNLYDRSKRRTRRVVGFPDFQSRFTSCATFRFRNGDHKRFAVRKHAIKVPHFGWLTVREGTARLRKLLRHSKVTAPGRILSATIHFEDDYWRLSLALEVDKAVVCALLSPSVCQYAKHAAIGCDLGVQTLLTLATADGKQATKRVHPGQVACRSRSLPKLQRRLAIKRNARKQRVTHEKEKTRTISRSETRARARLRRRYRRQKNVRLQILHRLTSSLARRCAVIGIEDLCIPNMMKNHALAGAIARQGWAEFRRLLTYKASWTGAHLVVADRFFPSTKRCSRCHEEKASVPLEQRLFTCNTCGLRLDRDVNAAINLAQYARQVNMAGPEVPGQGKQLAPRRLGRVAETLRGSLPRGSTRPARSSKSIAGLMGPVKARKGGVEFVNAP